MLRFISSLFSRSGQLPDSIDAAMVDEAVDRVIEAIDKRLKSVGSYRKRLRPGTACTLQYIHEVVSDFPGAIEISRSNFGQDGRVRALFSSYEDLQDKVYHAPGVYEYLKKCRSFGNDKPDKLYGVITVQWRDKTRPGIAHGDGGIQREELQVSVNFNNHSIIGLAATHGQAMVNLERRIFDFILQLAMEGIIGRRNERTQLEQQRRLLQRKLETMKSGGWGLEEMLRPESGGEHDMPAIDEELSQLDARLEDLGAGHQQLEREIESICDTLARPQELLSMQPVSMKLDRMNIRIDDDSADVAPVEYIEANSSIGASRIMMPGWFALADIPPRREFSAVI